MKEPGLDDRHRDKRPPKSGEIQQKRADTLNKNLPKPIPEFSPNATLGTMRNRQNQRRSCPKSCQASLLSSSPFLFRPISRRHNCRFTVRATPSQKWDDATSGGLPVAPAAYARSYCPNPHRTDRAFLPNGSTA